MTVRIGFSVRVNFAVFLDRDGVINHDPGNFHKIEELEILPRVPEALKFLNSLQIPSIVVTNQAVVARGWVSEKDVQRIHNEIEKVLGKNGSKIDGFYFCPHHPEADLPEYRVVCDCRKPKTALFEKAARKHGIDIVNSYVIGDSFREVVSAKNLGCKSIAVKCGQSDFRDSNPDYLVEDLYEAVKLILKQRSFI